jgi:hypothetical protein
MRTDLQGSHLPKMLPFDLPRACLESVCLLGTTIPDPVSSMLVAFPAGVLQVQKKIKYVKYDEALLAAAARLVR